MSGASGARPVSSGRTSVLRQRIGTAIVLVAALLAVVLWLPPAATIALLTATVLAGGWEWSGFLRVSSGAIRAAYVVLLAGCLVLLWWASGSGPGLRAILLAASIWWLGALAWVSFAPRRVGPWSAALAGVLALGPAWIALVRLRIDHARGAEWVLFALALVWAADTGAFFAGRRFGRVRLAPRVSPGKTWEGVFGGMGLALLIAWAGALWFALPAMQFLVLCIAAAAVSIVGDLTESMLKRHAGLKDSGRVFPGHGGVLDRIDSVTAAAPVFVLGMLALEGLQ